MPWQQGALTNLTINVVVVGEAHTAAEEMAEVNNFPKAPPTMLLPLLMWYNNSLR
jgi:hypothetical protein